MTYSVKDICNHYSVNEHTVLTWIRNGELKAINVGVTPAKKKPRWRITEEALKAFELLRSSAPPSPPPPRARRRQLPTDIIELIK